MRRAALVLVALTALAAAERKTAPEHVSGGNGTLYVGGFPGAIYVVDEATEKVTGAIKLRTGTPKGMRLSHDRKRFYALNVNLEDMEVVDIAGRRSVDAFRLSEGDKRVWILRSFEIDPLERFVILLTKTATKLADRFEIGPATLLQYNLKEHKVVRAIPWPNAEERERAELRLSPDGKLLYLFADDIVAYETGEFRQVDRWELSRPIEDGFGRVNLGRMDDEYEEPGFLTGIFNVQDPVQHRRLMGIARINLGARSLDFYTLGPDAPVSFSLAPGGRRGYGLLRQIGRYEFWTFDLENRRIAGRVEFAGRPRMALRPSSNGRVLYIHQAGATIDLYDAASYQHLRTITLGGDMETDLFVFPSERVPPTSQGGGR